MGPNGAGKTTLLRDPVSWKSPGGGAPGGWGVHPEEFSGKTACPLPGPPLPELVPALPYQRRGRWSACVTPTAPPQPRRWIMERSSGHGAGRGNPGAGAIRTISRGRCHPGGLGPGPGPESQLDHLGRVPPTLEPRHSTRWELTAHDGTRRVRRGCPSSTPEPGGPLSLTDDVLPSGGERVRLGSHLPRSSPRSGSRRSSAPVPGLAAFPAGCPWTSPAAEGGYQSSLDHIPPHQRDDS